jgi:hypothetical protein
MPKVLAIIFMIYNIIARRLIVLSNKMDARLSHIAYFDALTSSLPYNEIPKNYELERVVIIHRHGDRAQISRTLGRNYPENDEHAKVWKTKLPGSEELNAMRAVARREPNAFLTSLESDADVKTYLYSGWDKDSTPYGSLTSLGVSQMVGLGKALGQRYGKLLRHNSKPEDNLSKEFLLRSTDSCRTMQSLRAFLLGFYEANDINATMIPDHQLPIIRSKPKDRETLFPQADGTCDAITLRRGVLMARTPIHRSMTSYHELEDKIKKILGFDDHVPWLTVKEVVTCQLIHGIPVPSGITIEDDEQFTKLAAWLWSQLFHDKVLNRYAIGRFITEMIEDLQYQHSMQAVVTFNGEMQTSPLEQDSTLPKFVIYSGHDSTLVPLMCAMDVHDGMLPNLVYPWLLIDKSFSLDMWPPYASYLALEIARAEDGERYVRSVFNDEERKLFQEHVWCPYDLFIQRLQQSSISAATYHDECSNPKRDLLERELSEEEIDESRKEMQEEIQATLGSPTSSSSDSKPR